MQVLDYSGGYPRASLIKTKKYIGVQRYLRKEGTSHVKPLTATEYQDMIGQGLAVGLIGEHLSATRALDGYNAGRHDAQWWLDRAHEVGINVVRCVYLTVDFDANPDSILHYFEGARTVLGNANGGYGSYRVLQALFNRGLIDWGTQTYAWSRGHNLDPKTYEPRANLFQRLDRTTIDGIDCDINDVLHEDWGQIHMLSDDERSALFESRNRLRSIHTNAFNEVGDEPRSMQGDLMWFQQQLDYYFQTHPVQAQVQLDYEHLADLVATRVNANTGRAVVDALRDELND